MIVIVVLVTGLPPGELIAGLTSALVVVPQRPPICVGGTSHRPCAPSVRSLGRLIPLAAEGILRGLPVPLLERLIHLAAGRILSGLSVGSVAVIVLARQIILAHRSHIDVIQPPVPQIRLLLSPVRRRLVAAAPALTGLYRLSALARTILAVAVIQMGSIHIGIRLFMEPPRQRRRVSVRRLLLSRVMQAAVRHRDRLKRLLGLGGFWTLFLLFFRGLFRFQFFKGFLIGILLLGILLGLAGLAVAGA